MENEKKDGKHSGIESKILRCEKRLTVGCGYNVGWLDRTTISLFVATWIGINSVLQGVQST